MLGCRVDGNPCQPVNWSTHQLVNWSTRQLAYSLTR